MATNPSKTCHLTKSLRMNRDDVVQMPCRCLAYLLGWLPHRLVIFLRDGRGRCVSCSLMDLRSHNEISIQESNQQMQLSFKTGNTAKKYSHVDESTALQQVFYNLFRKNSARTQIHHRRTGSDTAGLHTM